MIKIKHLSLALASLTLLAACGGGSQSNPSSNPSSASPSSIQPSSSREPASSLTTSSLPPEKTPFEKAVDTFSKYDVEKTNGYDFSLIQYLGKTVVNSDTIQLRASFSSDVKAEKVETIKRLNEYGAGEQFTTSTITTYFENNMICEFKNNRWQWSNCKKGEYFAASITRISIDQSFLGSVRESESSGKYVISADVLDNKVNQFLNSNEVSFSSLTFKLTVSSDYSKFESLELSYFQENTRSEMRFSTYIGDVSIVFPN